jgi:hypothetical protein
LIFVYLYLVLGIGSWDPRAFCLLPPPQPFRHPRRETKRAEKAGEREARRLPIDDLELLKELRAEAAAGRRPAPTADVAQPRWLDPEESHRLAGTLFVADLLTQFGRNLGCKTMGLQELQRAVATAPDGGDGDDSGGSAPALHAMYFRFLQVVLDDLRATGDATGAEKRWHSLLSEGTWPEVLRRMVLTRSAAGGSNSDAPSRGRADEHASLAAGMLAFDGADALTSDQHLALLLFLADEVLDSDRMRTVLQSEPFFELCAFIPG